MRAQDLSIYRKAVGTKDGRLPPEPVLGDSVMSGRLLISGRHLILTVCVANGYGDFRVLCIVLNGEVGCVSQVS